MKREHLCSYCGRSSSEEPLHLDHITSWSAGGPTTLDNLRTACSDCNLGKGTRRDSQVTTSHLWELSDQGRVLADLLRSSH